MNNGSVLDVPSGGRGIDLDRNGRIDGFEGCVVIAPGLPLALRDCLRQTAIDYMQLVQALRDGIDLDSSDRLSRSDISYVGMSMGGGYGSLLMAVEPDVQAATLNVAFAQASDAARLSRSPAVRPLGIGLVALREPVLLNQGADFDDQLPLPTQPVAIRTLAGAAALQDFWARVDWLPASGDPLSYAPHFQAATLPGVNAKRILFQMALGDLTVPNPSTSPLIRAAGMREQTSLYRFDRAREAAPGLLADPHAFLVPLGPPQQLPVSVAALSQAVTFLWSGTNEVPDVNALVRGIFGINLFETPRELPNELNYQSKVASAGVRDAGKYFEEGRSFPRHKKA